MMTTPKIHKTPEPRMLDRLPVIGWLFAPQPPIPETITVSKEDWIQNAEEYGRMVSKVEHLEAVIDHQESEIKSLRAQSDQFREIALAAQRARFKAEDDKREAEAALKRAQKYIAETVSLERYQKLQAENLRLSSQNARLKTVGAI